MKRLYAWAALMSSLLLGACQFFGAPTAEQTLVAQNAVLGTEIAGIRLTATVEADRMMVTLEHAQTAIAQVSGQTQDLTATLIARGTPAVDVSSLSPQAPVDLPTPEPLLQLGVDITPIAITPGSVSQSSGALATAASTSALVITPVGPDQATLSDVVTASGVDENDCAVNPTNQFTANTAEIYVVARARNIATGSVINSRWFQNTTEVVTHEWVPDFDIEDACIWFYIDQSDTAFTPGNWRVQMEVDGAAVGAPVTFTIGEANAAGDALLEEAMGGGATTPTALP